MKITHAYWISWHRMTSDAHSWVKILINSFEWQMCWHRWTCSNRITITFGLNFIWIYVKLLDFVVHSIFTYHCLSLSLSLRWRAQCLSCLVPMINLSLLLFFSSLPFIAFVPIRSGRMRRAWNHRNQQWWDSFRFFFLFLSFDLSWLNRKNNKEMIRCIN